MMPPQQKNVVSNSNTAAADDDPPVNVTSTGTDVAVASSMYGKAPDEKNLEGKRLNKLDVSSSEHPLFSPQAADAKEESETENTTNQGSSTQCYWDAPAEQCLEGKRLSKIDLSVLEHQHLVENGDTTNTIVTANPKRKSIGAYWEWQGEQLKNTLSNLCLSNLAKGSRRGGSDEGQEVKDREGTNGERRLSDGNDWDDRLKQTLSNLSLSNIARDSHATNAESEDGGQSVGDTEPQRSSNNLYWFWRNVSMNNLNSSNASLTALEQATKVIDANQAGADGHGEARKQRTSSTGGGPYWFWRSGSMTNLSMSTASLMTLDKKARKDETARVSICQDSADYSDCGPITDLQHKMRKSWRKSFQCFSTNSLGKLNEGNTEDDSKKKLMEVCSGTKTGMRFASKDSSFDGASSDGSIGEDVITF